MKLKAILLITLVLFTETYQKCAVTKSSLDFTNLATCIGNYPKQFQGVIDKMSKSHVTLKTSTDYYEKSVLSILKTMSQKLAKVIFTLYPYLPFKRTSTRSRSPLRT